MAILFLSFPVRFLASRLIGFVSFSLLSDMVSVNTRILVCVLLDKYFLLLSFAVSPIPANFFVTSLSLHPMYSYKNPSQISVV